jgi:LSM domain
MRSPPPSTNEQAEDFFWLTSRKVFLNIVLDEAVEEKAGAEKVRLGMVVIRGNSVVMLEVSGHSILITPKVKSNANAVDFTGA